MGSAFLCAMAGIGPATIEQSASYLKGWCKALKEDKKLLITAAGQAQKAADHILGTTFEAIAVPINKTNTTTNQRKESPSQPEGQHGLG